MTDVFREALDARSFTAPDFGIDLRDIEYVDPNPAKENAAQWIALLVIIAGNNGRRVYGESAIPVKTYLDVFGVKSVISLL
ncbi:MAG TPA: hypothetical protein VIR01_04995 [Pyrinomonadaceae bacterium]